MAKQPYIPLYIGDWEQDTNCLSLQAEAAWLKIIFKMFKDKKSGVYKTTTKSLQNLWKCDTKDVQNILSELSENNICGLEIGDIIIFYNRRMVKEAEISQIRSKAVQTRYKTTTKHLHPLEYDNEYIIKVFKELENRTNTTIGETEKTNYMFLIVEMVKIFIDENPDYFFEKETDYHACLQIAYNIASMKKWMKAEVSNGKIKETLESWKTIVSFVIKDDWFKSRSLSDLSTTKEWQRLVQKMNGQKKVTEKKFVN